MCFDIILFGILNIEYCYLFVIWFLGFVIFFGAVKYLVTKERGKGESFFLPRIT